MIIVVVRLNSATPWMTLNSGPGRPITGGFCVDGTAGVFDAVDPTRLKSDLADATAMTSELKFSWNSAVDVDMLISMLTPGTSFVVGIPSLMAHAV